MKPNFFSARVAFSVLVGAAYFFGSGASAQKSDALVTPGVGIGPAKIGMTEKKMRQVAGNFDASYSLPGGIKVARADWKEGDHVTVMLKVFYGPDGKAVQILSAAATPYTADGITKKSGTGSVNMKYKGNVLTEYRAKNGRVDYYDAVDKGVAFQFRRLDEDLRRSMYAMIVHKPGVPVISDLDEKRLK